MSQTDQFVAETLRQLKRIEDELSEIETGLRHSTAQVDSWTQQQLAKLKADWHDVKHELEELAKTHQTEVEASWEQLRNDAEHHWQALHAAVQAYREHVHKNVA
ncbi:MAG: hypothetical protein AAGA00_02890 [Pseudomonadota bacterium]